MDGREALHSKQRSEGGFQRMGGRVTSWVFPAIAAMDIPRVASIVR